MAAEKRKRPDIRKAITDARATPPSGSIRPLGKRTVGNPFSKVDWNQRKAAMDAAIDGNIPKKPRKK